MYILESFWLNMATTANIGVYNPADIKEMCRWCKIALQIFDMQIVWLYFFTIYRTESVKAAVGCSGKTGGYSLKNWTSTPFTFPFAALLPCTFNNRSALVKEKYLNFILSGWNVF